jgi:hypothetical protein
LHAPVRGSEAVQQRVKISDYLTRVFIADADKDCGQRSDRLVAADVRCHGINCRNWIARKTRDQKPIDAFQNPIVDHGSVAAKSARKAMALALLVDRI